MRPGELPDAAGVAHRNVEVDGIRLHLAELGEGPPLLLLHGWPQHWWCWRRIIRALARDYWVLAPDLRGWGWSDAPPGDYAKATFASDILGLLDREGIERVRIIGHDWGGYAAFILALEHPERIERLLALDITPPWLGPAAPRPRHLGLPLIASYQLLLATPGLGERLLTSGTRFLRTFMRLASASGASWSDAELDAYAGVLSEPSRARASSACYRTFLTREAPALVRDGDRSAELRVPSLLAMGASSLMRRVLDPKPGPNLGVETIPGAGHFLPEEAPGEVLRLAHDWLRQ